MLLVQLLSSPTVAPAFEYFEYTGAAGNAFAVEIVVLLSSRTLLLILQFLLFKLFGSRF